MLVLSVTGILWRVDAVSVALSVLAALVASVLLARRFEVQLPFHWSFLLLLALLLVIPLLAASAPPWQWDEVAYGASLPRDYARAGRFFYNADYGPYSAFPGNYEAITTASLVLAGSVTLVRVFNVLLMLGLALVAAHLSLRVGVPRSVAPLAAVLVLAAPAVPVGALMVKNDLASAFFESLTLLALAAYAARRGGGALALAGFFLGTAVGTKYSSLQFALCVIPLVLALVLSGSRRPAPVLRSLAVFGGTALAAALPWYGRNLALFGNPFFPFYSEILGAGNGFTAQHAVMTREMFEGSTGFSWKAGTFGGFLEEMLAGFGWVPVVLSIPGLVLAVTTRRSRVTLLLVGVFVSNGLLALLVGYWQARYFLSLLVLASVLSALALTEAARAARLLPDRRRATSLAALALVVVIGARALHHQYVSTVGLIEALYHEGRDEFARARAPYWEVADWVNHNTVPGARVGMGLQLQPFFYVERPYFHIHPMTEKGNLQALETPEEYLDAFRSLGLEWLAVNRWRPGRTYLRSRAPHVIAFRKRFEHAVDSLSRDGKLELVARRGGVRIFRIKAPPAPD
jgi:4-amino-4-deoxy-L-arabinose transferase-like glycosyltransferase